MIATTRWTARVDRRGFLKGSALFAAALGPGRTRCRRTRRSRSQARHPRHRRQEGRAPPKKKPLLDKDGREYRVCDMCGGNMYKQEKTWTCEQCGFSYEE